MDVPPVNPHPSPPSKPRFLPGRLPRVAPVWLIIPAILATIATAVTASDAIAHDTGYTRVTIWWLVSLGLLLLAALPPNPFRSISGTWKLPATRTWAPWLGMIAIAAIPRLVLLDRFPTVLDGDESAFIVLAVDFRRGDLPDWFGIYFYGNPNGWAAAQGLLTEVVGTGPAGHRSLSALVGIIGVLATWRLGRHLLGEPAGTIGAILLAAWPLHLHLSRVALNNITDPAALALSLLFLVRTVTFRRPIDAVACGLSLASGLNGYYGGRAFPFVILTLLPILALRHRLGVRNTVFFLSWILVAFVSAATPLLATFEHEPSEFGGHMGMVSPFTLTHLREGPVETIRAYLPNLWNAIGYPATGGRDGYFRHGPPYFGWPLCVLIGIGAITLLVRLRRSRDITAFACLVIPWALLTAGIATTVPISGQRFLALTPIFALVAGLGLWSLASLAPHVGSSRLRLAPSAITILVLAILTASHLNWMASEDRQIENYGDLRTIAAWDLGWRLSRDPVEPAPTVYFAGAPFVWSQSFPSLTFLTRGLPMIDLDAPLETPADIPPLPSGAILILVPERATERCAIEATHPGVLVSAVLTRDNAPLYYVFATEPPAFWSTAPTLAETTVSPAPPATC